MPRCHYVRKWLFCDNYNTVNNNNNREESAKYSSLLSSQYFPVAVKTLGPLMNNSHHFVWDCRRGSVVRPWSWGTSDTIFCQVVTHQTSLFLHLLTNSQRVGRHWLCDRALMRLSNTPYNKYCTAINSPLYVQRQMTCTIKHHFKQYQMSRMFTVVQKLTTYHKKTTRRQKIVENTHVIND